MALSRFTGLHGYTRPTLHGMKVAVYKNLTRNCYSLKAMEGEHKGKVVAHVPIDYFFRIENAEFKVSEKTRQRVVNEGKKYVHAYVVGTLSLLQLYTGEHEVTYNPHKMTGFMLRDNPEVGVLTKAFGVVFRNRKMLAHGIPQFPTR
jgi:hypothetical protein